MVLDRNREGQKGFGGSPRWTSVPRWYLWDGGFMMLGSSEGTIPSHDHHAIQIVIAVAGSVGIRGTHDEWRTAPGIIVLPNVTHSYSGNGAIGAMLFIDPESLEGGWLKSAMRDDITLLPEDKVKYCAEGIARYFNQPLDAPEISDIVQRCVHVLCAGALGCRRLDARVTRVLLEIRKSDEPRMSLDDAAASAFLSPSRFAHLFKEQVGLPFRRYMLWRKLSRAMIAIGREGSITSAAYAAGFADAAHMTRTFYQMFGLPPSVMMRGEFFEVPSPFEVSAETRKAS